MSNWPTITNLNNYFITDIDQEMMRMMQFNPHTKRSLLLLLSHAITTVEIAAAENWNILGGDFQRTSRTNSSTIPESMPKERCKFETTHKGEHFYNSPVVSNGTMFIGSIMFSGLLSFLNPFSKEEDGPTGYVYSIDAETCEMNWEFDAGAWIECGVLFDDNIVYFGNGNGQLFALDAITGEEIWVYTQPESDRSAINSSPILLNDVLYFGSRSGHMNMVDKNTGELIKRIEVNGDFHSPLALSSKDTTRMYGATAPSSSSDGESEINVYAFNVTTGEIIWESSMPGTIYNYSPTVDSNDQVYYSSLGNAVTAFDGVTGDILWENMELPGFGSRSSISLSFGDEEYIYLSGFFAELLAISTSTGKIQWRTCLEFYSEGGIVDANGDIVVGDYDGYITKISGEDGSIAWKYCHTENGCDSILPRPLRTAIQGPPVLVDNILYFGSYDGNVYVLE